MRKRTTHDLLFTVMSSTQSTRFESLSNEILLDIFEYLDAYHMYEAWYGLNARINSLLQSAQLFVLLNPSIADKTNWNWNALTSFYKSSQIRILSCFDDPKVSERIPTGRMENLRTILFHFVHMKSINKIYQQIPYDNQIKCLSIQVKSFAHNRENQAPSHCILVDHSDRFLSLTHLSIECQWYEEFPVMSVVFPQLRHLSLVNFNFSHNLLQSLQTNMPKLRSLKFQGAYYSLVPSSVIVEHIHELDINVYAQTNITVLVGVLSNFPSLRRLHILSQYHRRYANFNGSFCQQLIERYLPHLKQLTVDFNPGANEEILSTFYKGDFWSTKKVKATTFISPTQSRYPMIKTISFGREWRFQYFDNLHRT